MQKIVLPAHTPELKAGGNWIIGNMQFNIPLSQVAAINEMENAASMLRDRTDVYSMESKRLFNIALRKGSEQKATLIAYTYNPRLMDEFMDHIVDVTAADFALLRELIKTDMQEYTQMADILSWVETARLLLKLSVYHFDKVISQGSDKFHFDYMPLLRRLSARGVLAAWERAAKSVDDTPERPASDGILEQLKVIASGYTSGLYLRECVTRMEHHPFFQKVKVEND